MRLFNQSVDLLLLSAGKGERLRPWTDVLAKPSIPFLSVPMSAWVLSLVEAIPIGNLVVNTHHLPETIEQMHWKLKWPCRNKFYSFEPKLLGSSGGIHQAQAQLGSWPFLVANADSVFLPRIPGVIADFLRDFERSGSMASLLCIRHPEVGRSLKGLRMNKGGEYLGPAQGPCPRDCEDVHFIGWAAYTQRLFHYFSVDVKEEQLFTDTLPRALGSGEKISVQLVEGTWFETGNPESFENATRECLRILDSKIDSFEKRFLEQGIRLYGGESPVFESQPLQSKIRQLLQKLRLQKLR